MKTKYLAFWPFLILTASCRSPASRTQPEPVIAENPPPGLPPRHLSSHDSWFLHPVDQQHRYRSSTVSTIVMDQPATSLHDSTLLTADFTLSLNRESRPASYSVTIQTFLLKALTRVSSSTVFELSSPVSFTGHLEPGQMSLSIPVDCSSQVSSALSTIRRSLVLAPLQLRRGQVWSDSTSLVACSGSIPVTLIVVQSYRVIGETSSGDRNGILLERSDKTISAGEGADGQHRIQLKSEGTGQVQLLIDSVTGVLLEATGANTTLATVTSSGRSQRFTQATREHITREN